ncbi:MAG: 4-hydroxythreonine-4-phosphate dehydrogenase PdxA [Sphaerochaetaceae bacterium]|jgi:4-hydroxythreonine-4-phosphate dehydrogenase|nr:4-hydroxythreonine-4-phosphate dehydrogenase PdxA [Bacteroidia bacterium]
MNNRPILGITMGDPSGIGPEIILKALFEKQVYDDSKPVIIGDHKVINKALKLLNNDSFSINVVGNVDACLFEYGTIDVFHLELVDMEKFTIGEVSSMSGNAAFQCVKTAIELALQNKIDATITAPLNKESLNLAGFKYSGHTEIYAELTKTSDYSMMLAEGNLKVVHVSTHVSLRQACDLVKRERVLAVIELAYNACRDLGIKSPKIAVAGLNPHAGENGLFGTEEINEIMPAISDAKAKGLDASGPYPPDTIFPKAVGGFYDIVVAMYHDQGHIPLKVLGFQYDQEKQNWKAVNGINVTLGLPIIRSSVDHGTAFEIAWKQIANQSSMLQAIDYGIKLAKIRIARSQNED